jgi:hypothetical protein
MWAAMVAHSEANGWKGGNFKNLNLPFENKLLGQPREVRDRMARRVEDFVYNMITGVFNAGDTADIVIDAILKAGSHDPGPKAHRIENPADWTPEKILERGKSLAGNKGAKGDFDD